MLPIDPGERLVTGLSELLFGGDSLGARTLLDVNGISELLVFEWHHISSSLIISSD